MAGSAPPGEFLPRLQRTGRLRPSGRGPISSTAGKPSACPNPTVHVPAIAVFPLGCFIWVPHPADRRPCAVSPRGARSAQRRRPPIGGDSGSGTQDIILGPSSSVIGTTFFADPRLRVTVTAWLTRLPDAGTHSRSLAPEGPITRSHNTYSTVERDRRIISSPGPARSHRRPRSDLAFDRVRHDDHLKPLPA
jgi:hypothetical protein